MNDYRYPKSLATLQRASLIADTKEDFLKSILKQHKISDDEYQTLKNIMGRAPTLSELGVFSAMWSEHCSYKSSRIHLGRFPTTGEAVIQGPGENAGIVRLHGKLGVAFKMESHNHPSYIEPYQGAATGVGGILRDVFCMGSRPIANLNCLRFGRREHPRTPYLFENVVKGIGDYGNCIGIPTVGGNISFDESYDGNCLVNAMTVGLIDEDKVFRGYATGIGNLVVYVGSSTGRDGIHGATMASDSFASKEAGERGAVQVGDPFTEKLLLEATLEVLEKKLVVGLQDMGAAGLTSSSFEMASRAENGLFMNLDLVPTRTENMSAYELMLSESQERMLMVVEEKHWPALKEVCEKWQLAHAIIGVVTDSKRVQAVHKGILEIDIPVAPITDRAPKYDRPRKAAVVKRDGDVALLESKAKQTGYDQLLLKMLADTGNKELIYRQYDQHIGRRTHLNSEHEGAAVLWIREESTKDKPYLGVAISSACNERYCAVDARLGATHSVAKAARMLYAVGATPLALTDCLNFGNPEKPEVMEQFSQGVDGIADGCHALTIPVVSGNVSLYNETDGVSIHPTPMIGMVGRVDDIRITPPAVLLEGSDLYVLSVKGQMPEFGGSLAAKALGQKVWQASLPAFDAASELRAAAYLKQHMSHLILSRDIGVGGVALAITKACLKQGLGFEASSGTFNDTFSSWFGERGASYLLAFKDQKAADAALIGLQAYASLTLEKIGSATAGSGILDFSSFKFDLNAAHKADASACTF